MNAPVYFRSHATRLTCTVTCRPLLSYVLPRNPSILIKHIGTLRTYVGWTIWDALLRMKRFAITKALHCVGAISAHCLIMYPWRSCRWSHRARWRTDVICQDELITAPIGCLIQYAKSRIFSSGKPSVSVNSYCLFNSRDARASVPRWPRTCHQPRRSAFGIILFAAHIVVNSTSSLDIFVATFRSVELIKLFFRKLYVYIYIYICVCVYMYIYIYIYMKRSAPHNSHSPQWCVVHYG